MKKPIFILISVLLLSFVCVNAFAYDHSVSFQVVNADTFEIITSGTLTASGHNAAEAKRNARVQLGFPSNSDNRTAGGVKQRIIWGKIELVTYEW
jgi:hypothetical protein